ncbi:MAG: hypothetical protein QNJ71_10555 [Acidimicrobiia bacterium]|nr:hypothetical protein [Acidimicrobiia bacterium]
MFDPIANRLVCNPAGTFPSDTDGPGDRDPEPVDDPGLRYVYTATDPVIGDCHYWSNVPGGLDAWNPANDPAVIAVVTGLPVCPDPPVDPEVRAWEVFRSWDLAPPDPVITPPDHGITGLATFVAATEPTPVTHGETLPDGRPLEVRARVIAVDVEWGDGNRTSARPHEAASPPDGSLTHTYRHKTCPAEYRSEHPSGALCHPTLEKYTITVGWVWIGEYNTGGGWTPLGTLPRTISLTYDVDEVRGVNVP